MSILDAYLDAPIAAPSAKAELMAGTSITSQYPDPVPVVNQAYLAMVQITARQKLPTPEQRKDPITLRNPFTGEFIFCEGMDQCPPELFAEAARDRGMTTPEELLDALLD